jgi:hypothetical protein
MIKIIAFIKKSVRIHWSYRFAVCLSIFGSIATILTYYFIDKLFGSRV